MAYFPNMTAWECWATDNCFKCLHWPQDEDAPGCPVEMAHTLYNYDQCSDKRLESVLSMLIPQDGIKTGRCGMFIEGSASARRESADRQKYEQAMKEMRQNS